MVLERFEILYFWRKREPLLTVSEAYLDHFVKMVLELRDDADGVDEKVDVEVGDVFREKLVGVDVGIPLTQDSYHSMLSSSGTIPQQRHGRHFFPPCQIIVREPLLHDSGENYFAESLLA